MDWDISKLDVQTAYVKMVPAYEEDEKTNVPLVMRLRKELVRSSPSPKSWYSIMDTCVVKIGLKPLDSDPGVYVYSTDDDSIIITANEDKKPEAVLALCVDALMLDGGDKALLKVMKETPMGRLASTGITDTSLTLGIQVPRNREHGTLIISLADYTTDPCSKRTELGSENPLHARRKKSAVARPSRSAIS